MLHEISRYIPDQLYSFISSQRCCQHFCGSFRSTERIIFSEYASELGFYTRNYVKNGIETVTVYKRGCSHHMEAEHLVIQRQSAKELFLLFHTHLQKDFIGRLQEMQISPDFLSPISSSCPSVMPCRFASGSLKQAIAASYTLATNAEAYEFIRPFKEDIIESISQNRVLIINGDYHFRKSTAIPIFLFENSAKNRMHCKIICVELNELLAAHNCETVANQLGEKVGKKVAYQVSGQSHIEESSNIIYTTAAFLLRVFMGQKIVDCLHHVSHVVINDVNIRDSYCDLLLSELRAALTCYSELRILLLSNSCQNSIYLKYFGEGKEINLENSLHLKNEGSNSLKILYIEEIRQLLEENCYKSLAYSTPPNIMRDFDKNQKYIDSCLEAYEQTGTDQSIDAFLYMVHGEFASINCQHSVTGCTALIISAKLGKSEHIRLLLRLHPNPYILDDQKQNALQRAIATGNLECTELLRVYSKTIGQNPLDSDATFFDCAIVSNLVYLITTHPDFSPGNILVFVPNYEQLIRVNFSLLRLKLIGKLCQSISIHVLHNNLDKEEMHKLFNSPLNDMEIIITTNIGEIFSYFKPISYVIDAARTDCVVYNAAADCCEIDFIWNSQESIQNRSKIIGGNSVRSGVSFRLIPRALYSQLPPVNTPELLTMPLDRICLTVKLLSPYTMVSEYLQRTIARPPFIHVYQTVEYLKRIEIFDSLEDITWLGCRLIDLPIECQLGKLLIFGILLQCFDPVLTIVSFLAQKDPLELPKRRDCIAQTHLNTIRYNIKEERKRLAGAHFSDHLMFLRLFQEWQNRLPDDDIETSITDEHDFVKNVTIENVAVTRSNLVSSLRSAQLIHNQGPLNMHSLNSHSENWAMIKLALIAGLYPKICVVDASVYRMKSGRNKELFIYPSSVLRGLSLEPLNISVQKFTSPWVVYSKEVNTITSNSIENCTLIAPFAVMMLAGPSKIHNESLTTYKAAEHFPRGAALGSIAADSLVSNLYIDEFIWCTMDATDAQLLLKTRQLFYSIYNHYLQSCSSKERSPGQYLLTTQLPRLLESLAKVLLYEDIAHGFTLPERVGDRPKAKPTKFLQAHNLSFGSDNRLSKFPYKKIEHNFFILRLPDPTEADICKSKCQWLRNIVENCIAPNRSSDSLTYLITYKRNPDHFDTISAAIVTRDGVVIREFFKNKIPIFDLINICLNHNIPLPPFNERRVAFPIEGQVGQILLDLFAFRDNWFHNN